jgi:hypothetical protein
LSKDLLGQPVTANIKTGTLLWSWENDNGVVTAFRIPNSYYVSSGKVRLLSPQHWAQTQGKSKSEQTIFREQPYGWESMCTHLGSARQQPMDHTVVTGRGTNVAMFTLAPGYAAPTLQCSPLPQDTPTSRLSVLRPTSLLSQTIHSTLFRQAWLAMMMRTTSQSYQHFPDRNSAGFPQTEQTIYKQQNAFQDNAFFNRAYFTFNRTTMMSTSEGEVSSVNNINNKCYH